MSLAMLRLIFSTGISWVPMASPSTVVLGSTVSCPAVVPWGARVTFPEASVSARRPVPSSSRARASFTV
jgi:hypothetical protein